MTQHTITYDDATHAVVPRKPSEEMIRAIWTDPYLRMNGARAERLIRTAIAAAPEPEAASRTTPSDEELEAFATATFGEDWKFDRWTLPGKILSAFRALLERYGQPAPSADYERGRHDGWAAGWDQAVSQGQPAASAEPLCWVPEDELPASLPSAAYDALYPYSRVDFIREFPVFGPSVMSASAEPVAVVGDQFALFWIGSGPIAPLIERHGIKVGTKLYAAPVAAQPSAAMNALRTLESACDALCSLRTREQYLSMIDGGQKDALQALDDARSEARRVLSASVAAQAQPSAQDRKDADHEVLAEHSGCGRGTQVEQVTVKLNPGDKVVMVKGRITRAIDAARAAKEADHG